LHAMGAGACSARTPHFGWIMGRGSGVCTPMWMVRHRDGHAACWPVRPEMRTPAYHTGVAYHTEVPSGILAWAHAGEPSEGGDSPRGKCVRVAGS
jgi:hypothetical protein